MARQIADQTADQTAEQIRRQIRRQMPTGSASMPTAAAITAEPMMAAAVEVALAIELSVEPVSFGAGPGRRSG